MQSNETRIVMPSVNMLPIESIKEALDKAIVSRDTQFVNGIEAGQIAKAYNGDREAVKRAYYLGERPAGDYLTTDVDPTEAITALEKSHQTEVAGLRLELYRLYEILNKQLGASYKPESGYLEDFINSVAVQTTASVINAGSFISEIRVEQSDFAIEKEYLIIDDNKNLHVAQIRSISNQLYTLEGSVNSIARDVKLYKVKGEMLKNTFSFSKTTKDVLSDHVHSVLLGDYADDTLSEIHSGLATNVKLRSNMFAIDGDRERAVLDGVRAFVSRNALASAAQITCKVYVIDSYTGEKPNLTLIGTSKDQEVFNSQWVTFKITQNGQPLELLKNQEILVAFECNSENAYKIMMGQSATGDLHTNRNIYTRDLATNSYDKTESEHDILLGLNFNGYIAEVTEPYLDGLYTSKTFINERPNNCLAQLQVKFKNINTATVQSHTPVDGFTGFVIDKQILGSGAMVVGNNIATFDRASGNTVFTDEHIAVYPGDEVYFIPVKAQIIASSELFEERMIKQVITLNPVRVTGDYLIFECQLPAHVKHFQTQIAYSDASNARAAALTSIAVSLI